MDDAETEFDEPLIPAVATPPVPEPIVVTPPPTQPKPEPVAATAPVQQAAASADLQTARTHADSGNLDSSVVSYEALIRANKELDQVVEDLTRLSKTHRGNPAIYRVLGDGLMRQGRLQAALDIYREALNQL
jgi:tetratricopeptide (TPR) repeat protein